MEWQLDAATDTMNFYLNGARSADLTVLGHANQILGQRRA